MSPPTPPRSGRSPHVVPHSDRLASVSRSERDGLVIAAVRGEIDVSNATDIGRELTEVSNRALGLVVDLGQVGHLDSTGVALLYELHARLARRGQSLVVVAPVDGAARRVLELTAFDTLGAVADEIDAAVNRARSIGGDLPPQGDSR